MITSEFDFVNIECVCTSFKALGILEAYTRIFGSRIPCQCA